MRILKGAVRSSDGSDALPERSTEENVDSCGGEPQPATAGREEDGDSANSRRRGIIVGIIFLALIVIIGVLIATVGSTGDSEPSEILSNAFGKGDKSAESLSSQSPTDVPAGDPTYAPARGSGDPDEPDAAPRPTPAAVPVAPDPDGHGSPVANPIPIHDPTPLPSNAPSGSPGTSPTPLLPTPFPSSSPPTENPSMTIQDFEHLNFGFFEGDIKATYRQVVEVFGEQTAQAASEKGILVNDGGIFGNSASGANINGGCSTRRLGAPGGGVQLWPNKTIYWKWSWRGDSETNEDMRDAFIAATIELTNKVNLNFIETSDSCNYIEVVSGSVCSSSVGMIGGRQSLTLADDCYTDSGGIIVHELLHALGMWHAQSMFDREKYVQIIDSNMERGKKHNFWVQRDSTYLGLHYDYGSIMHYKSTAFGNGGSTTINAIGNHYGRSNGENQEMMGNREGLSDQDAVQLQLMYHCPSGPRKISELCTPECPCTEGQGQCRNNDDCEGNLRCERPSVPYYRHRTHRVLVPDTDFKVCVLGDCDCDYHAGGCSISKAPPENWACRCEYEGAWTCSGHIDYCYDDNDPRCQNPDKGIRSCAQGGGDCGGYTEAEGDCDCDYDAGGCSISGAAPSGLACKCEYKGAWTCGGQVQRCLDPFDPKCLNPDRSIASCAQGGGDCGGYTKAQGDCDCDYHSGGCSISKVAPSGLACQCEYKGAWTCGGHVQRCLDPGHSKCKNPDKSIASCAQGGGDCGGYTGNQGACDCDYSSGGCKISTPAPNNLACQCSYKGFWTCGGSTVRCRDPSSHYCKNSDYSYLSCLQGGGDCGGY